MTMNVEPQRAPDKRLDPLGRGVAVGYTGAYCETGAVELEDVVAVQNARGPE
jgi:hypothetical protein